MICAVDNLFNKVKTRFSIRVIMYLKSLVEEMVTRSLPLHTRGEDQMDIVTENVK